VDKRGELSSAEGCPRSLLKLASNKSGVFLVQSPEGLKKGFCVGC